jgi:hypothetical protein
MAGILSSTSLVFRSQWAYGKGVIDHPTKEDAMSATTTLPAQTHGAGYMRPQDEARQTHGAGYMRPQDEPAQRHGAGYMAR